MAILLAGGLTVSALLWFGVSGSETATVSTDPGTAATPAAVPTGGAKIVVHVTGAVRRPGLVELAEGGRVSDAIAEAGGFALGADASALNLARLVADGEQLLVPLVGNDASHAAGDADAGPAAVRPDGRIDLNRATAADLEQLPGIGPVLAERIISWRDQNGPFTAPGQLREVPGIGERTFQNLVDLVAV